MIDTLGSKDLTNIFVINGKVNLNLRFQFDGL